jgi:hypothetical protein
MKNGRLFGLNCAKRISQITYTKKDKDDPAEGRGVSMPLLNAKN